MKAAVVIIVDTIGIYPREVYDYGIDLVTASVRRIPMESLDPRVKSLNYLALTRLLMAGSSAGHGRPTAWAHAPAPRR